MQHQTLNNLGVYLHIPFCRSRCSYCDFATDVYKSAETVERYVRALVSEVSNFKSEMTDFRPGTLTLKSENSNFESLPAVDTIYFGGGTPSLLTPRQLEEILRAIDRNFSVRKDAEITMEMNPATMTLETVREYRSLGVNRASFGAQTFDDRELKRLGRRHTAAGVRETIDLLRKADFRNVSFDLIAGLPRQTLADWERNLTESLKLRPEHLSLYLLEIHEGTPLAEQIRSRRQPQPDEDLAAEMYELMIEKTTAEGYRQYEISNFSRPGFESRHNSKYWLCEPVYGFGVSAHSFDGHRRRANERDTNRYVSLLEKQNSPVVLEEEIDPAAEYVFLGLRMMEGIDLDVYRARFGVELLSQYEKELERLQSLELLEVSGRRLRLTRRGALFSNEVFAVFV